MVPQRGGKRCRSDIDDEEEELGIAPPVVSLCSGGSSDDEDEEANRDLSLEIVERARKKVEEEKRRNSLEKMASLEPQAARAPAWIVLLSSSSDEAEGVSAGRSNQGDAGDAQPASAAVVELSKKKKKKRKRKKQKAEGGEEGAAIDGQETVDVAVDKSEEELTEVGGTGITEANGDISDNVVFRKLLRGPRYFDPGCSKWESCYNCGEEGHIAALCTAEKRKKPCFVCGMFGHNANKCSQGQYCFICKRRGHLARDCPDKHQRAPQDNKVCLRCGGVGHDMSVCGNAYARDDLKEIQCYVCKDFGHFCCVDFIDTAPREICCYNCGDSGHSGVGCAKPRGESSSVASPTLCYVCGEEGHFARGCTKKSKLGRQHGEPSSSTPKYSRNRTNPRYPKSKKDFWGSKPLLDDFGRGSKSLSDSKVYKKNHMHVEGKRNPTVRGSKIRGGWIVDDHNDLPIRDIGSKPWKSPKSKSWKSPNTPRTPARKIYRHYDSQGSSHKYNRLY